MVASKKFFYFVIRLLILVIFATSCVHKPKSSQLSRAEVFDAIRKNKTKDQPIGGSYIAATSLFKNGNGKSEAEIVYEREGALFLVPTNRIVVLGVKWEVEKKIYGQIDQKSIPIVVVPGLPDVKPRGSPSDYTEVAGNYIADFNGRMAELAGY